MKGLPHNKFPFHLASSVSHKILNFEKNTIKNQVPFPVPRTYPIDHSLLNTGVSLTRRAAGPGSHLQRVVGRAREGRAVSHIALHASIPALALRA